MASGNAETYLVKLAALRSTVDQLLGRGISYTGTGLGRTEEIVSRFRALRAQARDSHPDLFGDVPDHRWWTSIASQSETLREVRADIDYMLMLGAQAGLYQPVQVRLPEPAAPLPAPVNRTWNWVAGHLVQIAVGLVLAYLIFRFG